MPKQTKAQLDAVNASAEIAKHNLMIALDVLAGPTVAALQNLSTLLHNTSRNSGFWPDEGRNDGECIALMHSELSEALEALREGNPASAKLPANSLLEEELADCIIRILDYAGANQLDVAGALFAKAAYNLQRPKKHGKEF